MSGPTEAQTRLVLIFLVGLASGWEFYTLTGMNATISETIWIEISGRPFIPFFVGIVCGHLFWQRKSV